MKYRLKFKTANNKLGDKAWKLLWDFAIDINEELAINRTYNVLHKNRPNEFEVEGLSEKACSILKDMLTQ